MELFYIFSTSDYFTWKNHIESIEMNKDQELHHSHFCNYDEDSNSFLPK